MTGETRIYATPSELAKALAELVVQCGQQAIAARGTFTVSLAGGTTPKAAYEHLAQPPFPDALDWSRVEIFFGDERAVGPDDPRSNYKMARESFLRTLDIPEEHIHRMRGEDDPAKAADAYRKELVATLGAQPRLDLVMLGMGPDGHTASLFPGADPLTDDDLLVRAVYSATQTQWRITLTPRVLNRARTIAFAVEGAAKAKTLALVRQGPINPVLFPSQSIAATDGKLIWLLDREAAAQLA